MSLSAGKEDLQLVVREGEMVEEAISCESWSWVRMMPWGSTMRLLPG